MPDWPGLDRTASNYENAAQPERKFLEAGGLLMAGFDPTGDGATLPGSGDQHEVELLVSDAGFIPVETIPVKAIRLKPSG